MNDSDALHALARSCGIHLEYIDGLGQRVEVSDETLLRLCAAMGVPVTDMADCPAAWRARQSRTTTAIPPVIVAWDGVLHLHAAYASASVELDDGDMLSLPTGDDSPPVTLPLGYHHLRTDSSTHLIIAAPMHAFRHSPERHEWGVALQLAALRTRRSRAVGDLKDLEALCQWVGDQGGRIVQLLPLLPTYNTPPVEPSPYSPVSRLFWSELMLDLGENHQPVRSVETLDVMRAHGEVWHALMPRGPARHDDAELDRYARFRAAQERWGRNWRDWPEPARSGDLSKAEHDPDVAAFHVRAQQLAREQLHALRERLDHRGVQLGLDLTVGVHPDGYDAWSRQYLFAPGVSVGAPPDPGFPSGQDWGFHPMLPDASQRAGHRYLADALRHQMAVAGVLRVDHVMAFERLYWIPHGMALHEGSYVDYPADELFAVLTLESHRNRCEVVGENLGTVPASIEVALERHRIHGLYMAQFQAAGASGLVPPRPDDMALIGSHDTPTLLGWITGEDIAERQQHHLIATEDVDAVRAERAAGVLRLASLLGVRADQPRDFLFALLEWLGKSPAGLVAPWLEDLWLEHRGVNLPGTSAAVQGNWQRPMARTLEEMRDDPQVLALMQALDTARRAPGS